MTQTEKLSIVKDRLNKLENKPEDVKAPGVIRKLKRQIRLLENKIATE